jgi:CDP-diacylglycerol--glycerol-3-phosphate 3-phosphatidyltransferase
MQNSTTNTEQNPNPNLNLPNFLALFRILLAPLMLLFLFGRDSGIIDMHPTWYDYFAGLIFVIASITDFFDGFIARKWNQSTKLGAILDPLADKMLIIAGLLGLMMIDRASVWAVYLILVREVFITGLRVMAASEGKEISASFLGKVKTFAQIFAIGFLIVQWPYATELLWFSVIATLYSGYEYTRDYIKL